MTPVTEMVINVVSWVLLVGGCFFLLVGGIGILRLPDFYARTHAVSLIDTLGVLLPLTALALQMGWVQSTFKVVLIFLFLLITSPTTTHAIARAARHHDRTDKR